LSSGTSGKQAGNRIEVDLIDLDAFKAASFRVKALNKVLASGENLLPGFRAFGQDIFAIYFKYNVVVLGDLTKTGRLTDRALGWTLESPALPKAKEQTRLEAQRAGIATANVLERVLQVAKSPAWFDKSDLLDQWKLDKLEEEKRDLEVRLESVSDVKEAVTDQSDEDVLEAMESDLEEELTDTKRELRRVSRDLENEMSKLPLEAENLIRRSTDETANDLEQFEELASTAGLHLGLSRNASAEQKIRLGQRLHTQEKLKRLADLVGLFKQVARAARKQPFRRRPTSVHSIERGDNLSRVLSSELATLRHPTFRRDFLRKLTDGLLQQYALNAPDPAGRGPIVACLDASGSMRGAREIWSKAIALTLLDIAKRERRSFRAIVFSGQAEQTTVFPLLECALDRRIRPPEVDIDVMLGFVDEFPNGGTNFEHPLRLAVESLGESRFHRGDIIFISDGGAAISPHTQRWLDTEKERLDFKVFGILVDTGSGARPMAFADETLPISELSTGALRGVFSEIGG